MSFRYSYENYYSYDDNDPLGYDLRAASYYNDVVYSAKPRRVLLELTGENDGAAWHWIVELENGRIAYVSGGCDYTGWDCRSHADIYEADDLEGALRLVPEDKRAVFNEMIAAGETVRNNPTSW